MSFPKLCFRTWLSRRATPLLVAMAGLLPVHLLAQQSPATPATTKQAAEETVALSPFAVVADPRDSYQALNTSSLTGTNRSLDRLPITAEIFNAQMLEDLGTSDVTTLLSRAFTGIGMPDNGTSAASGLQSGDSISMAAFTTRGLGTKLTRNGFATLGNLGEGYAYERLEMIRGPQSLLYGIAPAGALMNATTKRAMFGQNRGSLMYRTDANASRRYEADVNGSQTIAGHRVALRVAAFDADTKFWRDVIHAKGHGGYAELAVELLPVSQTVLRVSVDDHSMLSVQPKAQNLVTGAPSIVANNTPLSILLATHNPALAQIANGKLGWENIDSLAGNSQYQARRERFDEFSLSSHPLSWLSAQLQGYQVYSFNDNASPNSFAQLRPPLTSTNPLNAWAVAYSPADLRNESIAKGLRGLLTADFNITRHIKNQLVLDVENTWTPYMSSLQARWYQVDSSGNFVRNAATLTNTDGGRTLMPAQWVDVLNNMPGYVVAQQASYTINGITYRKDWQKSPNSVPATPDNPYGYNSGPTGALYTTSKTPAYAAVLYSDWFGDRVSTLVGVRHDHSYSTLVTQGMQFDGAGTTGNAGVVWKFSDPVSFYAGASSNFSPSLSSALRWDGVPPPNGKGESIEAGFKVNAYEGRLSGSVTAYQTRAINLSTALSADVRTATDPTGINGSWYSNFQSPVYTYNRTSRGVEVTLTAQPLKSWRNMIGFAFTRGIEADNLSLPFFYNDQFNANSQGQVLLGDGTPLRVPISTTTKIAADGKTYAATVPTEILTISILKNGDPNGNYKAQIAPSNGQILNASSLGLTIPGVGTGRVGLPISQHQLGYTPPTPGVQVRQAGEITSGYPRFSFTATSMYSFSQHMLKGFSIGFNLRADRDLLRYYYNDAAAGNVRKPFYWHNGILLNPVVSYEHALVGRVRFRTQLNLNNALGWRPVEIAPNLATGVQDNAVWRNDPRTWVWTNTISF